MTDFIELDSLFQKNHIGDEPQYEKIEFIQLADEQGGVYDSGEVSFNSQMVEMVSNQTKLNALLEKTFF